jgi:hypothetical protein
MKKVLSVRSACAVAVGILCLSAAGWSQDSAGANTPAGDQAPGGPSLVNPGRVNPGSVNATSVDPSSVSPASVDPSRGDAKPLDSKPGDPIPGDSSLGDPARQTRAQHDAAQPSKAQALVDEMQQEQEAGESAPTGFKNYNAGDYRLVVPFPYSLEGREDGGAVLMGSSLGVTNTEVMAGAPIPIPAGLSDVDLQNVVRQFAALHGGYPFCSLAKLGSHKAFHCYWNGTPHLLGREVWGTMEVVITSNTLIPVMCVSPDEFQCYGATRTGIYDCQNHLMSPDQARNTKAALETRFRDEKTTGQVCDQIIYPSIQLKEDIVVHPASISEAKTEKAAASAVPQDTSVAAYGAQSPSLGDLARQTRQATHSKAQATLDNAEGASVAPPGFQSFTLQYCQNPQQCSEGSVVIPEKAELVSHTNGQHIFKTVFNGDPVLLYAGPADVNAPYRSLSDPDYIRMRDLANSNGWSREKADAVSTQELTIEGRPALMTRFRYQRDQKTWWIGERALIEIPGVQFMVGCTAPEQHFADAEAICTTLVNSLRLP